MKNLVVLILGVFLFVALTEGFSVRTIDTSGGLGFQRGQPGSQPLTQLIRERRDGWDAELKKACIDGDHDKCDEVCRSGGSYMGACRGGNCRCYE